MTDKVSLPVAQQLKEMGWDLVCDFCYSKSGNIRYVPMIADEAIVCFAPTIGELQAAVTDDDIVDYISSEIGAAVTDRIVFEYLRSADLLAEVLIWKLEKEKRWQKNILTDVK